VILYGLYLLIGATGLLVLKALTVAATAEVMLRTSRRLRTLWVPALCTILGLLAMSPRLFLQPVVVSYLFLALTLYFLLRPHASRRLDDPASEGDNPAPEPKKGEQKPDGPELTWKTYWPLLLLFVLWVNLDAWFFLGPVTVGLFLLGQLLPIRDS